MSLDGHLYELVLRAVRQVFAERQPELLTPAQAGDLVGRSAKTILRWVEEGKLHRHGPGKPLVSRSELLALVAEPKVRRAPLVERMPKAEAEVRRLSRRTG